MSDTKITVLMPVYNGGQYLRESIESILKQTYADFEFLIIDDGSTDKSAEIIRSYDDKRIRFVQNGSNLGLIATLNKGLDLAESGYIARMDCDDISMPERLKKQIEFMDKNPDIGVCGGWMGVFGEGPASIYELPTGHEEIACSLLFGSVIAHPSVMFRKKTLDRFSVRYSKEFKASEDYELWFRMSKLTRLANIPEVLLKYRLHQDNTSQRMPDEQKATFRKIVTLVLKDLGIGFSPEELNVHFGLAMLDFTPDRTIIVAMEKWLVKLLKYNHKKKIFKERVFSKVLLERWLRACKRASRLRTWILFKMWASPLWKEAGIGPLQRTLFIYRQFVRVLSRKPFIAELLGKEAR